MQAVLLTKKNFILTLDLVMTNKKFSSNRIDRLNASLNLEVKKASYGKFPSLNNKQI